VVERNTGDVASAKERARRGSYGAILIGVGAVRGTLWVNTLGKGLREGGLGQGRYADANNNYGKGKGKFASHGGYGFLFTLG